jgi:hypothetical protein
LDAGARVVVVAARRVVVVWPLAAVARVVVVWRVVVVRRAAVEWRTAVTVGPAGGEANAAGRRSSSLAGSWVL